MLTLIALSTALPDATPGLDLLIVDFLMDPVALGVNKRRILFIISWTSGTKSNVSESGKHSKASMHPIIAHKL